MFLFYVLSFFMKEDTIQGGGDIIQRKTLFKEIRYIWIALLLNRAHRKDSILILPSQNPFSRFRPTLVHPSWCKEDFNRANVWGYWLRWDDVEPAHGSITLVIIKTKQASGDRMLKFDQLYLNTISKHYRRLLVLWKGTCAPKAQKPVTLP